MKTAQIIAACLAAMLAGPLYAAGCDKVSYVEAKDWPVKELERAYCIDKGRVDFVDAMDDRHREHVLWAIQGCREQVAMYERILRNIHKRPLPACK